MTQDLLKSSFPTKSIHGQPWETRLVGSNGLTYVKLLLFLCQVSSGLLQTAQTWANAGVCGGLCACAVGGTFD